MSSDITRFSKISDPFSIVLVLLGVSGLLASTRVATGQELYGTLQKITRANTLTIGFRESSPPFSFIGDNRQPSGYAIDLCNKIAEDVKVMLGKPDLKVDFLPVTPQTRIPLVANHTVDMECGSTTNTLSRQLDVDFSSIFYTTGTRILTRKIFGAKEIGDFQGKSIGAVTGSTNERAIRGMVDAGRLKDIRLVGVSDYSNGLTALEGKSIDGFVTDDIVLFGLLGKSSMKSELEVIGRFLTYDPYGIMIRRDDSAFRRVVNKTLADLFRSGEIWKIYAKWFDPIGVPVSPLLKAAVELQALPE